MASTLLKLNDSNGNLKEMTTAEEAYIAYQVAAYLAGSGMTTASAGAVKVGTGNKTVGTYTNSYFNQNVGTHPASSITSGSTNTTLIQLDGTRPSIVRPISWDGTADGIKELTDSELDTVVDRILAYMMANEWAGTNFRLSTSTPAGYSSFVANFASDTQSGNGAVTNYSLFKKTTLPAQPSVRRPLKLTNTFNVAEMTDTEIQNTFGPLVRYRMTQANDRVGRYLLLPSGQTPNNQGYGGTWVSRGTMTDTKDTTSEVSYSADYSATYSANYTSTFTGDFVGDYIGTVNYQRTSTRNSVVNYQRNSVQQVGYGRPYARVFNYSPNVYYIRAYYVGVGYYSRYYTRTFSYRTWYYHRANYVRYYLGDYVGDFAGNYLGDYVNENINFSANYTQVFTGDFVGNYLGNYVGNYTGTTINSADTTVQTYTLYTRTA